MAVKKAAAKVKAKSSSTKKAPVKKAAKKHVAKKAAPKKATSEKAAAPKKKPVKKAAPMGGAARADFGAPIDGFIAKQLPEQRAALNALRKLVEEVVPEAQSSIKWGAPVYTLDGKMLCALGSFKSHVSLMMMGPKDAFADPHGQLHGSGKSGRTLRVNNAEDVPTGKVRGWLKTAAAFIRR